MSILDDDAVVDGIRRVLQSAGGADATAVLRDFGVVDLLREDRGAATEHLFYEQGRLGTHSHAYTDLQDAVLASHFPGPERTVPMSLSGGIGAPLGRFGDGTATGVGYTFGRPADLVFMVSEGPQNIAVAVACAGPGVTLEQVHGIDPTLELWKVTVTRVPAEIVAVDDAALAWWLDAVAWGRLAFAWELVGSARTMLDQAVDHARNRVQFGRPIGTFQAVQHRLAETLVAIEGAHAVLDSAEQPLDPIASATAKSLAGRAFEVAAKNCLQVLGGIGFTTEHPFDRYLRRGSGLNKLLGSRSDLVLCLGRNILEFGSVPALSRLD
jgi:Acyl-CoA dehydrogenase, C-terminal domain